ncbi:MAG: tRNA 2-thiouridine(34) synthase MnmA, partial [Dehalococcoidia bacterium]
RTKKRVVVAMSGGVDSSLTSALLQEAGYEVIGITMRLWPESDTAFPRSRRPCCLSGDVNDARGVCHILGIPYYVLNFEPLFRRHVVELFCREYARGRTPNPCLACNQEIKFRFLLNKVLALGAECLATGHYGRIDRSDGEFRLLKGVDPLKDQSYVLYTLGQRELKHLLLPLGEYSKDEVRHLAAERNLPVAEKRDSQEICFVPDGDYRPFVAQHLPPRPGDIVDSEGRVLGRHPGIAFFTVGQRHGLGLSSKRPLYVVRIDALHNRLVAGPEEGLYSDRLWASRVHWVSGEAPPSGLEVRAKIRYRSPEALSVASVEGDSVWVRFERPQRAITPGQAVVFYRGDEVLGGGIIEGG